MSIIDDRREQLLPKRTQREIDRLRRAQVSRYTAGEPSPGMFVLLSGSIAVTRRDRVTTIVELEPGHFLAEIGDLSGRPALVDAQAVSQVKALLIPPQSLHSVLIAETELGDQIMRAFIVRRATLIEIGAGGPR
jgi:thioredoxin reductase (NADPH)